MVCIGRGATDSAPSMLLEVMDIAAAIGSKPAVCSALDVCAGLAAALEDWKTCAMFFGAAEASRKKTGLRRDPADEAFISPLIAAARDAFGPENFDGAAADGDARTDEAEARAQVWLEERRNHAGPSAVTAC